MNMRTLLESKIKSMNIVAVIQIVDGTIIKNLEKNWKN